MPRIGGYYYTPEEYEDARQDAAYDAWLDRAERCADCGELYVPKIHRATRLEPAWSEGCPKCGGVETVSPDSCENDTPSCPIVGEHDECDPEEREAA